MIVEFHPLFDRDLTEAADYYEKRDPGTGLGLRFAGAVETAVGWVEQNCEAGAIVLRRKGIRRVLVDGFPYVLHYQIMGPDRIRMLGVYHTAINPQRWTERA